MKTIRNLMLTALAILPAASFASTTLTYTTSCEVLRANFKSHTPWVSIASKEMNNAPSEGKSNPDIFLTADDLEVRFSDLFAEIPMSAGKVLVVGRGFLKIKNTRTHDELIADASSNQRFDLNSKIETQIDDPSVTLALGYTNPASPNSYMVSCKTIVKN